MTGGRLRLALALTALAVLGAVPISGLTGNAGAAVVSVTCTGNPQTDGETLARAVTAANTSPGDDVLELQACPYQVSQPLVVSAEDGSLTITGGGVVDGGGQTGVFEVTGGARLLLTGVTVTRGVSPGGGGAVRNAGTLEVRASVLENSSAVDGGAISSSGTTRIERSLLRGNASRGVGGTRSGRGNHVHVSAGLLTVDQSTLVDGIGTAGVGAVYVEPPGTASLLGNTWTGNTNYTVFNSGGRLSARNNVITETGGNLNCFGPLIDNGGNLSSDDSCAFTDPTSRSGVATPLRPLGSYGGGTPSRPLAPGGPAINIGGTRCGPTDQRGVSRPQGTACDSGAVESAAALRLSPINAQYESTPAGSSSTQTFTVTSAGTEDLVLGAVRLTGSPAYTVTRDTCSNQKVPPNLTCVIDVRFTPTDTMPQSARLVFVDNSFNGPHTGNADGVGTPPSPSPSPSESPSPSPSPSETSSPSPDPSPRPTRSGDATPGPSPTASDSPPPVPSPSPTAPAPPSTSSPSPTPIPSGSPSPTAQPGPPASGPGPTLGDRPEPRGDGPGGPQSKGSVAGQPPAEPDLFFTAFVPPPTEVPTSLAAVAGSSLLALLLLALLSLPVTVVNETLTSHRVEIAQQLAWLRKRWRRLPSLDVERLPRGLALAIAALGGAAINSFLDPGFGLDRASAISFLGLLGSLLLLSLMARLLCDTFCERRFRASSTVRVLPGFWVLALVCVVLSRTTGLRPGLLLGTLAAIQVGRALNAQEEGEKTAFAYVVTAATSVGAWLAYGPVTDVVKAAEDPAFGLLVLQTVLATIFLGGVGGSLFGLIPLDFLDGATLRRWNPYVWFGLFFAALFGFVHVLLRYTSRDDPLLQSLGYLQALLAIYLACAAAFWGYWRWHDRRKARQAPVG